jgi:hypothetical protein
MSHQMNECHYSQQQDHYKIMYQDNEQAEHEEAQDMSDSDQDEQDEPDYDVHVVYGYKLYFPKPIDDAEWEAQNEALMWSGQPTDQYEQDE